MAAYKRAAIGDSGEGLKNTGGARMFYTWREYERHHCKVVTAYSRRYDMIP